MHLSDLDGVMIGRAAYQDPYWLAQADAVIFGDAPGQQKSRHEICFLYPFEAAEGHERVNLVCLCRVRD